MKTKISIIEDYGNAPEKQVVRDFSVALANEDIDRAMSMVSEDIRVRVPGYEEASGKNAVRSLILEDMQRSDASELAIKNILSDGGHCAADGIWKFADGGEVAFCTMYTLTNHPQAVKIREMTTYAVVLTSRVML